MKYGVMTYLEVDGNVLMIRKNVRENDPNSGLFTLPGGKLTEKERGLNHFGRLEAAIRETEEETGIRIIRPRIIGAVLFNNFERTFDNWKNPEDYFVYLAAADEYAGNLKAQTDEGTPVWVRENAIRSAHINIGDERIYEWIKTGRNFIGNIKHKGRELDESGTFVDYFD